MMSKYAAPQEIISQFVCYAAVGVTGTVAHYAVMIGSVQVLQAKPVVASAAGFMIGALVNYIANYHITFQSRKRHDEAMVKFFSVAVAGLALNTTVMICATDLLRLHYLMAQVIATGVVLGWNFTANRFWTFRDAAHASPKRRGERQEVPTLVARRSPLWKK